MTRIRIEVLQHQLEQQEELGVRRGTVLRVYPPAKNPTKLDYDLNEEEEDQPSAIIRERTRRTTRLDPYFFTLSENFL